MTVLRRIVFALSLVFVLLESVDSTGTLSITDLPAYMSLRSCARTCIDGPIGDLAYTLDCGQPFQNDCMCRLDLQARGDAFLRSCVSRGCSGATVDISSAVSLYDNYCTSNGYVQVAVTATTATTGTASRTGSTAFTATSTSTSTTGTDSNTSTNSSEPMTYGGLTLSDLIGVIVGVGGVTASLIGAWFGYKAIKEWREDHRRQEQARNNDSRHYPNHQGNLATLSTTEWRIHSPAQFVPPPRYNSYNSNR